MSSLTNMDESNWEGRRRMNNHYEIVELYQMLLADESWEPDQEKRIRMANIMYRFFVGKLPGIPKAEELS